MFLYTMNKKHVLLNAQISLKITAQKPCYGTNRLASRDKICDEKVKVLKNQVLVTT